MLCIFTLILNVIDLMVVQAISYYKYYSHMHLRADLT